MPSINQIKYGSIFILIISFLIIKFQLNFSITYTILYLLLILILIIIYCYHEFMKNMRGAGYVEKWHDLYREKIIDIPYYNEDNKIIIHLKKVVKIIILN